MSNRPLETVNHRHRLICLLLAQGKTIKEASKIVGMNHEYVERILSDPKIQELREEYRQEILERMVQQFTEDPVLARLRNAAPRAISRIETEVDNEDATPKDRLTASDLILSKLGYTDKPTTVTAQQNSITLNINSETLEEILSRGRPGPQPDHVFN